MEGGSVDELLGVTNQRPALDQLEVEVGRMGSERIVRLHHGTGVTFWLRWNRLLGSYFALMAVSRFQVAPG